MDSSLDNWKTQIKKGYLELCILLLIVRNKQLYGFDLIERLEKAGLPVKEGTLYPLLNRMTADGLLSSVWETQNLKGHPRKFYSLTKEGKAFLSSMSDEFERMFEIYQDLVD